MISLAFNMSPLHKSKSVISMHYGYCRIGNVLYAWADLEKNFRGGQPNIVGIKLAQLNVLLKLQLRTSLVVSQIPV